MVTLGLPGYWQQVVLLFEAYRQITHCPDERVHPEVLQALPPGLVWLLAQRWPHRMPVSAVDE
jgi:thymidylate synthase